MVCIGIPGKEGWEVCIKVRQAGILVLSSLSFLSFFSALHDIHSFIHFASLLTQPRGKQGSIKALAFSRVNIIFINYHNN